MGLGVGLARGMGGFGTGTGLGWRGDRFVRRKLGRKGEGMLPAIPEAALAHTVTHLVTHTGCHPLSPAPNTFTDPGVLVQVVAQGTLALEAAEGVDTVPSLAQPWQLLALVNV